MIGDVDEGLWQLTSSALDGLTTSAPVRVRVPADTEGRSLTIELTPAAAASGVVLSPEGQPVRGARVFVDKNIPAWMLPLLAQRPAADVITDAQGRFQIGALEPGSLALYATSMRFCDGPSLTLDVLAGQTLRNVELTLRHGATLTGILYGSDGRPAASKLVQARNTETEDVEFATTDVAGEFRFENLEPGGWFLVGILADSWEPGADGVDQSALTKDLATSMAQLSEGETTFVILGSPHQEQPVVLNGHVRQGHEPWAGAWMVMYPTSDAQPNETKFRHDRERRIL